MKKILLGRCGLHSFAQAPAVLATCSSLCFSAYYFGRFKASNVRIHGKAIVDASCVVLLSGCSHPLLCLLFCSISLQKLFSNKQGGNKPHFAHIYLKIHHAANVFVAEQMDYFILYRIAMKLIYYCIQQLLGITIYNNHRIFSHYVFFLHSGELGNSQVLQCFQ